MAIKYLSSLNLNNNELQNAAIHVLSSAPSTPVIGQVYYNSGDSSLYVCTVGGATPTWVVVGTEGTATSSALGSIKLFSDTEQSVAATSVSATAARTYGVQLNSDSRAVVNVPWTNTTYGIATDTTPGLIELFNNTDQSASANTVTSTAGRTYGIQLNAANQAVVNVPWVDTNTTYSAATTTTPGLIELEDATVQTVAANTVTATASRTYGLQVNSDGQGVINVPWTDTVYTHTTNANLNGVVTSTGNTTAIADAALSIAKTSGLQTALNGKVASNSSITGATKAKITFDSKGLVTGGANLVAADIPSLDASKITTGTIDAAILPSYVDDVLEFANLAAFPATGATGKIYIAIDTNKTYRWSGSVYVYITSGAVDTVAGRSGAVVLTKADVNLGNVDNTADSAKNVFTATKLTTPRAINGVDFNGTAAITVTAAAGTLTGASLNQEITGSSLTSVGTLENLTVTNAIAGSVTGSSGSTTGNAATATSATKATNIAGGTMGSIPYQTGANTTTLLGKGSQGTILRMGGSAPAWAAISYAATIGDNTATSFTVTHGLGTKDIIVQLYDLNTGETVMADIVRGTTGPYNTVTIAFNVAPTTNQVRVLITKIM